MSAIENGLIRYRSFSEEVVDILDLKTQYFRCPQSNLVRRLSSILSSYLIDTTGYFLVC